MKKVLYRFAVLAMAFTLLTSCDSNSDDAPSLTDTSNVLPVQVDIVTADGQTEVVRYSYDGMKLIKEEYIDGYKDYIYEDELLIENNVYSVVSSFNEGILESYTYDAQGRVDTIVTDIPNANINTYTLGYNENDSIITYNLEGSEDFEDSQITIANGNVVTTYEADGYQTTYDYDNNNAPFQNIEQRGTLMTIFSENNNPVLFSLNNVLKEDISRSTITLYTYTYTNSNFPRTMTENRNGEITTYTFTYNND